MSTSYLRSYPSLTSNEPSPRGRLSYLARARVYTVEGGATVVEDRCWPFSVPAARGKALDLGRMAEALRSGPGGPLEVR